MKYRISIIFSLLCFLLMGNMVVGQKTMLRVFPVDSLSRAMADSLKISQLFASTNLCTSYIKSLPELLKKKGFIAASIDSSWKVKDTNFILLFTGNKYRFYVNSITPDEQKTSTSASAKLRKEGRGTLNKQNFGAVEKKQFDYHLANGYPFATISLDSFLLSGDTALARLQVDKGIHYRFDSIRNQGAAKIEVGFLYHYLGIQPGSYFNLDKLNTINQLLLQLPYLEQAKEWDLTMLGSSFIINLYLQPKKCNQIDLIAGLLPANDQNGGNLLFTGEATLRLKNTLAKGETISGNWQQLQVSSPRLNLNFQLPYLFNSTYGVDLGFSLYKKDSTFLNITAQIGLQYLATAKQSGVIALQQFTSNLLWVDTNVVIATKRIPDVADVRSTSITLDYSYFNTNYRPNPIRGFEYGMALLAGTKNIKKSNSITQLKGYAFDYSKLYDSVQLQSYQLRLKAYFAQYIPLGLQSVLKLRTDLGWLESQRYFRNELFQIGGFKLLRGFDEESVVASRFGVATIEYRYLVGLNSYFNAFTDVGLTQNGASGYNNQFIGLGLGMSFETKKGIVNISYAAGKRNDIPFNIRQAKIHIGFVTLF